MKTAQLLQTLNDQLSELAALVAPLAEHATLSPRFDRQLFHTRSTLMQAYLAEAQHNFNQLRQAVERQQPPRARGGRPKPRFAHQGGSNPPVIVIHGNALEDIGESYRRYLEGFFREKFDLAGTPLRIEFRTKENPFVKDDNKR